MAGWLGWWRKEDGQCDVGRFDRRIDCGAEVKEDERHLQAGQPALYVEGT